jgi:hypothetical protein
MDIPPELLHFVSDPTSAAITTLGFMGGMAMAFYLGSHIADITP